LISRAIVFRNRKVATQIHAVVQDTRDFDRSVFCHSVQEQVASTSPVPGHVECMNVAHNVVALSSARYGGSVGKLSNGLHQGCSIGPCLSGSGIVRGPLKNGDEIAFSLRAEANLPSLRGHMRLFGRIKNSSFREFVKIIFEFLRLIELLKFATIERAKTQASRFPQRLQFSSVFRFTASKKAESLTQHFARILILT